MLRGSRRLDRISAFVFLFFQLAGRDIKSRYRGTTFGLAWTVLNPAFNMAMYVLVFGGIFKAKWPGVGEGLFDFALFAFSGLVVHGAVSECLVRGPTAISGNASLVKKSRIPAAILPSVVAATALANAVISIAVLSVFILIGRGSLPWQVVLAPLVLLTMVPFLVGSSLLLAATGTYFRDLPQLMPTIAGLLLFLAPIFYPRSAVPGWLEGVIAFNPITYPVEAMRAVLLGSGTGWLPGASMTLVIGLIVLLAGFAWFRLAQRGFSYVI